MIVYPCAYVVCVGYVDCIGWLVGAGLAVSVLRWITCDEGLARGAGGRGAGLAALGGLVGVCVEWAGRAWSCSL